jgi:hypothetical protein
MDLFSATDFAHGRPGIRRKSQSVAFDFNALSRASGDPGLSLYLRQVRFFTKKKDLSIVF